MAYVAYVTNIKNLRPHPNADRLQLGECFGNTVCVSLDYVDNQLGVYFPTDGQLSKEFSEYNNLLRKKDSAGNSIGGYMDPDKRNVKAINLRGEKSDGLFLPLTCLEYTGADITLLAAGDSFAVLNGHDICTKYIPRSSGYKGGSVNGNKTRKVALPVAPLFKEHADTEQLAYNLNAFHCGDQIEVTLKMHGTSQRTAYVPVLQGYKRTLWDKITGKEGTPIYDWGYVSGTRRVVLDDYDGGFYGSNEFREEHSKFFEGKLLKGETVYYEVLGYVNESTPIMGDANNKKINNKDFAKQYGEITRFSYGCEPGESITRVYRMTMTNEDGDVVEYTPDFMRYRCEQMGAECVPVLWKGYVPENPASKEDNTISAGEWVQDLAELYYDGPDPVGKTHVREGVVVRIINRPKFTAYKHKNFSFKVLEGIIKEDASAPDLEEAQDVANETN